MVASLQGSPNVSRTEYHVGAEQRSLTSTGGEEQAFQLNIPAFVVGVCLLGAHMRWLGERFREHELALTLWDVNDGETAKMATYKVVWRLDKPADKSGP